MINGTPPSPSVDLPKHAITHAERVKLFGHFDFTHMPIAPREADRVHHKPFVPGDPEHVQIDPKWIEAHLVVVEIPHLVIHGRPVVCRVHKLIERQFLGLWDAVHEDGLLPNVVSWNGSFVTRFKRKQGAYAERVERCKQLGAEHLSNHSWGTAFDLNAAFNGLNTDGALIGEPGCLRAIVPLAEQFGFYWGGHFHDPMHFEAYKVIAAT